ncbi:hypothetical protein PCE1_001281 [Barthelona sp. PCE]
MFQGSSASVDILPTTAVQLGPKEDEHAIVTPDYMAVPLRMRLKHDLQDFRRSAYEELLNIWKDLDPEKDQLNMENVDFKKWLSKENTAKSLRFCFQLFQIYYRFNVRTLTEAILLDYFEILFGKILTKSNMRNSCQDFILTMCEHHLDIFFMYILRQDVQNQRGVILKVILQMWLIVMKEFYFETSPIEVESAVSIFSICLNKSDSNVRKISIELTAYFTKLFFPALIKTLDINSTKINMIQTEMDKIVLNPTRLTFLQKKRNVSINVVCAEVDTTEHYWRLKMRPVLKNVAVNEFSAQKVPKKKAAISTVLNLINRPVDIGNQVAKIINATKTTLDSGNRNLQVPSAEVIGFIGLNVGPDIVNRNDIVDSMVRVIRGRSSEVVMLSLYRFLISSERPLASYVKHFTGALNDGQPKVRDAMIGFILFSLHRALELKDEEFLRGFVVSLLPNLLNATNDKDSSVRRKAYECIAQCRHFHDVKDLKVKIQSLDEHKQKAIMDLLEGNVDSTSMAVSKPAAKPAIAKPVKKERVPDAKLEEEAPKRIRRRKNQKSKAQEEHRSTALPVFTEALSSLASQSFDGFGNFVTTITKWKDKVNWMEDAVKRQENAGRGIDIDAICGVLSSFCNDSISLVRIAACETMMFFVERSEDYNMVALSVMMDASLPKITETRLFRRLCAIFVRWVKCYGKETVFERFFNFYNAQRSQKAQLNCVTLVVDTMEEIRYTAVSPIASTILKPSSANRKLAVKLAIELKKLAVDFHKIFPDLSKSLKEEIVVATGDVSPIVKVKIEKIPINVLIEEYTKNINARAWKSRSTALTNIYKAINDEENISIDRGFIQTLELRFNEESVQPCIVSLINITGAILLKCPEVFCRKVLVPCLLFIDNKNNELVLSIFEQMLEKNIQKSFIIPFFQSIKKLNERKVADYFTLLQKHIEEFINPNMTSKYISLVVKGLCFCFINHGNDVKGTCVCFLGRLMRMFSDVDYDVYIKKAKKKTDGLTLKTWFERALDHSEKVELVNLQAKPVAAPKIPVQPTPVASVPVVVEAKAPKPRAERRARRMPETRRASEQIAPVRQVLEGDLTGTMRDISLRRKREKEYSPKLFKDQVELYVTGKLKNQMLTANPEGLSRMEVLLVTNSETFIINIDIVFKYLAFMIQAKQSNWSSVLKFLNDIHEPLKTISYKIKPWELGFVLPSLLSSPIVEEHDFFKRLCHEMPSFQLFVMICDVAPTLKGKNKVHVLALLNELTSLVPVVEYSSTVLDVATALLSHSKIEVKRTALEFLALAFIKLDGSLPIVLENKQRREIEDRVREIEGDDTLILSGSAPFSMSEEFKTPSPDQTSRRFSEVNTPILPQRKSLFSSPVKEVMSNEQHIETLLEALADPNNTRSISFLSTELDTNPLFKEWACEVIIALTPRSRDLLCVEDLSDENQQLGHDLLKSISRIFQFEGIKIHLEASPVADLLFELFSSLTNNLYLGMALIKAVQRVLQSAMVVDPMLSCVALTRVVSRAVKKLDVETADKMVKLADRCLSKIEFSNIDRTDLDLISALSGLTASISFNDVPRAKKFCTEVLNSIPLVNQGINFSELPRSFLAILKETRDDIDIETPELEEEKEEIDFGKDMETRMAALRERISKNTCTMVNSPTRIGKQMSRMDDELEEMNNQLGKMKKHPIMPKLKTDSGKSQNDRLQYLRGLLSNLK